MIVFTIYWADNPQLRLGCRLEIMAEKKAKEVNIVDQNAIWRETIRKENRCQKLYTEYHINPYKVE